MLRSFNILRSAVNPLFRGRRYHGLTGGQVIYQKLLEKNVKDVFLYTGGAVMPLIDAFFKGDINYYINTHEQSSGHAATAYAKSRQCYNQIPGISIVTSGPGLTNSVTPLTDATNDSVPFILFSGQVPLASMGTNAFQECPSVDITKPVTKWSYCVEDVNELPDVVDEAFKVSTQGKPGSVHIDLPKCVTSARLIDETVQLQNKTSDDFLYRSKYSYSDMGFLINQSDRPVLLIGQGCNPYADELKKFAKSANIHVTTTIHAMGVFDETDDLSLEFLGMHGHVAANKAIQEADLIIAIGTRFDDRTTGKLETYAPKAFEAFNTGLGGIIHVNINPFEIESVVKSHYNFNMDAGIFLNSVLPYLEFQNRVNWKNKIKEWKKDYPFIYRKAENKQLKTQQVIDHIGKYLLNNRIDDYIITTGVGNHQMMSAQYIKWKQPNKYISSGSLGVMGVGLPFAIGSQIANPDKMVIDIDGDGSFNHTLAELKTIQNYNLPIKIAVMNDTNFGMVRAWENLFFKEKYAATDLIKNPSYTNLAESFGIKSIYCDSEDDLENKIDQFIKTEGPVLAEFKVVPDLCLPLVSPGKSLNDMILLNDNLKMPNFDTELPPG